MPAEARLFEDVDELGRIVEAHERGIVTSASLMVERSGTAHAVESFRRLVRRDPTHVDSHHHVHRDPRVMAAFVAFADRHGLPPRDHTSARHCGVYGQGSCGGVRLVGFEAPL